MPMLSAIGSRIHFETIFKEFIMDDKLKNIFNYLKLSENLATAGQPLEEELTLISKAGFEVVINLALHDADYSLADESMSIKRLGMQYEHLPVIWEKPTNDNLERFFELMGRYENRKLFVHCAANMRVSAFMALYRILRQGWSYNEAMQDVHKIWHPNEIWSGFINRILSN